MEEAEVDVVRPEVLQLPGDGLLDLVLFRGPAVLAADVVRAEVDLEIDGLPQVRQGLAVGGDDRGVARRQVKVVDAALHGGADGVDDLALRPGADDGGAHADDADLLPSVGQGTILHMLLLFRRRRVFSAAREWDLSRFRAGICPAPP